MLALCDRFKVLPSQVRAESTELLRLAALEQAMKGGGGG